MPTTSTSVPDTSPPPHLEGEFALVFVADEPYALTTAVALRSALRHLDSALGVDTYVLDTGLTTESRERLQRVARKASRSEIHWIKVPLEHLVDRGHRCPGVYARLLMPELLPSTVTRVLYLDGDIVVRDDLGRLFEMDLGKASFAAVRDFASPRSGDHSRAAHEPTDADPVFNSGVLVVELMRWRENGFARRTLDFARTADAPMRFGDQQAMNIVATSEDWLELDLRWNVQVLLMYRPNLPYTHLTQFLYQQREDIYRNAAIIHFNAVPKPWQPWSFGTSKGKTLWAFVLVRSGWSTPTESLMWAVPWLGRRVSDFIRRAISRRSSVGT